MLDPTTVKAIDGMFDGMFDGMLDGMFDGMFDRIFDGMFDRIFDGMFDGMFAGMFDWMLKACSMELSTALRCGMIRCALLLHRVAVGGCLPKDSAQHVRHRHVCVRRWHVCVVAVC